jgi:hypothetical protein
MRAESSIWRGTGGSTGFRLSLIGAMVLLATLPADLNCDRDHGWALRMFRI